MFLLKHACTHTKNTIKKLQYYNNSFWTSKRHKTYPFFEYSSWRYGKRAQFPVYNWSAHLWVASSFWNKIFITFVSNPDVFSLVILSDFLPIWFCHFCNQNVHHLSACYIWQHFIFCHDLWRFLHPLIGPQNSINLLQILFFSYYSFMRKVKI